MQVGIESGWTRLEMVLKRSQFWRYWIRDAIFNFASALDTGGIRPKYFGWERFPPPTAPFLMEKSACMLAGPPEFDCIVS
jgi:hypothetical protein